MARPFSDIRRAEQLMAELTRLKAYEQKTGAEKQTLYDQARNGPREKFVARDGWIQPFGGANVPYLKIKAPGPGTGASAYVPNIFTILGANRCKLTAPAGATDSVMNGGSFRAARIKLAELSAAARPRESRFTGRGYKQREVNSVSSKFGRSTATESYTEALTAMADEVTTFKSGAANGAKRIVTFYPQFDPA